MYEHKWEPNNMEIEAYSYWDGSLLVWNCSLFQKEIVL